MMQNNKMQLQPIIPSGWTYLAHGSNTGRWKPEEMGKDFVVARPLCCVTKQDAEADRRHGFRGSVYTYSASTAQPFQIRVLFFKNVVRYMGSDCEQIKKELSEETIQDITNYYSYQGWRHPAVPSKTKLVKIAQTDYDEVYDRSGQTIYWYVPEKYLDAYKKAVAKEENPNLLVALKGKNGGLVKKSPTPTK